MRATRRILVNLAVFGVIAGLFMWWAVANIVAVDFLERPFGVTGDFENAFGVLPGAEVTYLGTQVGRVKSLDRIPGGVRVNMDFERGRQVPALADAHIWRKSALG